MKEALRWLTAWACLTGALSLESRVVAQDAEVVSDVLTAEIEVELEDPADAAPRVASAEDLSHLNLWIAYMGKSARRGRLTSGATLLVLGPVVTAIGISLYVSTPQTELDKGLGIASVLAGGVFTAVGIARLAKESTAEQLLTKWNAAKDSTLTLQELGRFEGELRAYSRLVRRSVKVSRWTMFGLGMTGALILGITPAADLSGDAKTAGYLTGGILAGVGFLSFGFTFIKSANVDYWAAYQKGQRPPQPRWSAAPSFGRSYAGMNVVGRF